MRKLKNTSARATRETNDDDEFFALAALIPSDNMMQSPENVSIAAWRHVNKASKQLKQMRS